MDDLFRAGGPHKIRKTGAHLYHFSITIPSDSDGLRAHECPADACTPAYFKVKPGTGLSGQSAMYCPYCRAAAPTDQFYTQEQIRFAKDQVAREAEGAVTGAIASGLGLGPTGRKKFGGDFLSMELSFKPGTPVPVRPPREEPLRRDVRCPHCTLEQAVFGLAIWCSDCGKDIFTVHVAEELRVLRVMLDAVPERREKLGRRVAARDVEDALENTVSVFEAVMKFIVRRQLVASGKTPDEAEAVLRKIVRNAFQSISRGRAVFTDLTGHDLFAALTTAEIQFLSDAFETRHPIAHNLGVVDRAYLAKVVTAGEEGREVAVSATGVARAVTLVLRLVEDVHMALFTPSAAPPT